MTRHSPTAVPPTPEESKPKVPLCLLLLGAGLAAIFVWSGVHPRLVGTWWLEVMPVIMGIPILVATYRRLPLTPLSYVLIWIHAIILLIGGHYIYAEMPLFNWIRDAFHLSRNHYDRVGHLAQGFVPAILAREILLRTSFMEGE